MKDMQALVYSTLDVLVFYAKQIKGMKMNCFNSEHNKMLEF